MRTGGRAATGVCRARTRGPLPSQPAASLLLLAPAPGRRRRLAGAPTRTPNRLPVAVGTARSSATGSRGIAVRHAVRLQENYVNFNINSRTDAS